MGTRWRKRNPPCRVRVPFFSFPTPIPPSLERLPRLQQKGPSHNRARASIDRGEGFVVTQTKRFCQNRENPERQPTHTPRHPGPTFVVHPRDGSIGRSENRFDRKTLDRKLIGSIEKTFFFQAGFHRLFLLIGRRFFSILIYVPFLTIRSIQRNPTHRHHRLRGAYRFRPRASRSSVRARNRGRGGCANRGVPGRRRARVH